MTNTFKNKYSFEKRSQESKTIKEKYIDRIPVIVQKHHDCDLPDVDKCKYLVPKDMTMGQFLFVIRKRIKIEASKALFIMVDNNMVTGSNNLSIIYDDHRDEDGFLYITYTTENTFG